MTNTRNRTATVCLLSVLLVTSCSRQSAPPYSPQESLKRIKIAPGYRIEPFLSEPDVVSPVAMDFDENGNLYVVEDRGYPLNVSGKVGRVKLVRDTDGDGIPDKSTVFADKLVMPTGVMRWKKGILVTDAPDLLYLEDTNGDGVADVRKVILTGFAFTNPQHTVNNPVFGLDNWIYLAHENAATAIIFKQEFGDRGSDIRYADRQGAPVLTEHGRNVRLRPDTGELEALASPSQFGHSFDDWGRHFLVSNSNHIREEAIAARYLLRNPDLPVGSAVEDISDHLPAAKVFSITEHPRFELLTGVGEFTSACGITYYRGSTFVAEPAHSLIHQDLISDSGSIYRATRAQKDSEFLASTDAWFRPVNMTIGPDGAMYVMDYYRLVIEHPEWMSSQHHHHSADLTKGDDRGRIYRIVPNSGVGTLKGLRLGSASDDELVQQLANPVIWYRRNAQRLLIDRHATGAVPALTKLVVDSPSSVGRVHALWTLEGLGRLDPSLISRALQDKEAGVRENAIILAEQHVHQAPDLEKSLTAMAGDPASRVRYQLMLTLGNSKTPAAQAARDRILASDLEDKWIQIAALSAGTDEAPRLLQRAMNSHATETTGQKTLVRSASAVVAARQRPAEIEHLLATVSAAHGNEQWKQTSSLDGLAQGLRSKRGTLSPKAKTLLLSLFESNDAPVRRAALQSLQLTGLPPGPAADKAVRHAETIATDNHADADLRADSLSLMALSNPEQHKEIFAQLIDPKQPEVVQEAAVRAYGRIHGDDVAKSLLAKWRELTPAVRGDAADAMYLEPSRERLLVTALQQGDVQPWTLAFRHKRRLIMNTDASIRDAARPILEQTPKDREAVVKQYETALQKKGDPRQGEEIFKNICSKCHRLNGKGADVGPDLGTVRSQPKESLLTSILIPSQSIAQGYESYVVETKNGGSFDGVIGPQTPTTITLRHENGKEDVIQRQDIKNMYVTNLSAMPADLEKQISVDQMAGLLEYLKSAM